MSQPNDKFPGAILLLALSLALSGCAERRMSDEIEAICEDRCQLRIECGYYAEDFEDVEDCLPGCVETLTLSRDLCEAQFSVLRCWSTLSCDEADAYAVSVQNYAMSLNYDPSFPCRAEFIREQEECWPEH